MNMARVYLNCPWQLGAGQSVPGGRSTVVAIGILIGILLLTLILFLARSHASSSTAGTVVEQGGNLHYAIVIDCGSSGSRVYVYFWPPHSGNPNDLLSIQQLMDSNGDPVVKKVSPGLSELEDRPDAASDHIKPLLQYAKKYIPPARHKETPLYILATAGMRMIPEKAQKAILDDLHRDIPKEFDFLVAENNFEVISGKQEGVYAWIAVNFVLGKFNHGDDDQPLISVRVPGSEPEARLHTRRRTVGMLDMGGGSVQIAFEITNDKLDLPKALIAEFNLGCRETDLQHSYRVYVTTFLGYGANSARDRYEESLLKAWRNSTYGSSAAPNASQPIPDPCLPLDMPLDSEDNKEQKVYFKGTGQYDRCRQALRPLLNQTVPCEHDPCSMNGVHQPHIDYDRVDFFGFSEFWYTMEDVYRIGGQYSFATFDQQAKKFCGTNWSMLKKWYDKKLYPKADESRFKSECFKSAWMTTVFHDGFKFPEGYKHLRSAQLISGKDVQWTLGALIFRTRFMPLRQIESMEQQTQRSQGAGGLLSRFPSTELVTVLCFVVVITAICLYMKRLRLCPQSRGLPKVASFSKMLQAADSAEKGMLEPRYSPLVYT